MEIIERNNKACCLTVVKGDIHLFWSLTAATCRCFILIKQQTNKVLQPECVFNIQPNQSKFQSQLLGLGFLILSFRSSHLITVRNVSYCTNLTGDGTRQTEFGPPVKEAKEEHTHLSTVVSCSGYMLYLHVVFCSTDLM